MTNATLSVPDISCGHCKMSIEGALNDLSGISRAEVNVDAKTVDVEWDDTSLDMTAIVTAISEQGYEVAQ